MSRNGASHYIASSGPDENALVAGFRWLLDRAKASGNRGFVAVPQKSNLDNIAHWSQLAPVLTQLKKQGAAKVGDVTLTLFTGRDRSVYHSDAPILAIYGGQKLLDAVDAIDGSAAVLYVPWMEDDHADWVATWNATPLGQSPTGEQDAEPTAGVVLVALRQLTAGVNLNTGIVHPSDYESAVRTLETLFHKAAGVSPEEVRRQLVRLGWDPKDAAEVKTLADKIWEGRRPKQSTGRADDGLWDYWQTKVD